MLSIEGREVVETGGGSKVLVYVDGSRDYSRAVEEAARIAAEKDGEVVLVTVLRRARRIPEDFMRYVALERLPDPPHYIYYRMVGESVLAPYVERLRSLGVSVETIIEVGDKGERIEAVAKSLKPSKLVLTYDDLKSMRSFTIPLLGLGVRRSFNPGCPTTLIV